MLDSCMLGSFVPCLARYGIFQSPSGKCIDYLCDALRGKPSILAEPVEDFFILLCPFIPFGTCGWGSQLHTAIIAVWQFILVVHQYIICSWSTEHFPESDLEGTSHAFWCYLSVPQPEIYV